MLRLDTESLIHDNQLDINRRLPMLAAYQEHFQDIENMMKRVDESGQNITVPFTDALASGLDFMKSVISTSNTSKVIGLASRILRCCEEIDKEFVENYEAQHSS
jgi:hypothetical protein